MRKIILLINLSLLILYLSNTNAQINEWTWVSGDNTLGSNGVYGTMGTSAPANKPGSRDAHNTWVDNSGNLWLFGGTGKVANGSWGFLNDLWKFNIGTNEWTWVNGDNTVGNNGIYGTKGTAALTNKPGSRGGFVTWTDNAGNLWLFGGNGYDVSYSANGLLGDLWKYDVSTNEWTWVSGSSKNSSLGIYGTRGIPTASAQPGARQYANSWTDKSGNLWLFGGFGFGSSGPISNQILLNDLWKYSIATNQWTWISGDTVVSVHGTYGARGVPATDNVPGSRNGAISWIDISGNLWLFGGEGSAAATDGFLNDLWKYNTATNQWTWVSGDNSINKQGVYGAKGLAAAGNKPGSRVLSVSFMDNANTLWLFGGSGYFSSNDCWNDLWKYDITTNQWTWVSGDTTKNGNGVYGTPGVADTTNKPGSRAYLAGWTGHKGQLWIFGGTGYGAQAGGTGSLNDLWRFNTNSCARAIAPIVTALRDTICQGTSAKLKVTGSSDTIRWQSSINDTIFNNSFAGTDTFYSAVPSQTTYYRVVTGNSSCLDTSQSIKLIVPQALTATFNAKQTAPHLLSFNADSSSGDIRNYHWDFGDGQISTDKNPAHAYAKDTTYYICLTLYDGSNCSYTFCRYSEITDAIPAVSEATNWVIYPNPFGNRLNLTGKQGSNPVQSIAMYDALGRVVENKVPGNRVNIPVQLDVSMLASGMYYLIIRTMDTDYVQKVVKQ